MSDFYTKKQKKWWCDHCKKFIEYTNISIDQHKKSKIHLKMVNHNLIYENRKARAKKLMESTGGVDSSTYSEIIQIEKSAQNSFNTQDSQRFQFGKEINNFQNKNNRMNNNGGGILSHKDTYNISNNLLEEIKLEKFQAEHKDLFNKRYLKKKKNREWGVFFDEISKRPYYHNFLTRISQWEKPDNYDGPEEEEKKEESENQNVKEDNKETNLKENSKIGVIGKWEEVDSKDSFFVKYRADEEKVNENFYSEFDFIKNNNDPEDDDNQEDEEFNHNGTIDDYINGREQKLSYIPNLENNEIIDINEKLKRRDFDLRYVNQSFTTEEKNLNYIKPKPDELAEGQTISFNFKTRKDENMRKIKKPIFFDED